MVGVWSSNRVVWIRRALALVGGCGGAFDLGYVWFDVTIGVGCWRCRWSEGFWNEIKFLMLTCYSLPAFLPPSEVGTA